MERAILDQKTCQYQSFPAPVLILDYREIFSRYLKLAQIRHLFRVIGTNMVYPLVLSVAGGHLMTVVATDGNPIQPIEGVERLIINGGTISKLKQT